LLFPATAALHSGQPRIIAVGVLASVFPCVEAARVHDRAVGIGASPDVA
jgi:hypothetical protein